MVWRLPLYQFILNYVDKIRSWLGSRVEERAKAQEYSTVVVDHCFDYFEKLGYQNAAEHDIKLESGDAPLLVKYLWDNLTDAPHGIVKFPEHFINCSIKK